MPSSSSSSMFVLLAKGLSYPAAPGIHDFFRAPGIHDFFRGSRAGEREERERGERLSCLSAQQHQQRKHLCAGKGILLGSRTMERSVPQSVPQTTNATHTRVRGLYTLPITYIIHRPNRYTGTSKTLLLYDDDDDEEETTTATWTGCCCSRHHRRRFGRGRRRCEDDDDGRLRWR